MEGKWGGRGHPPVSGPPDGGNLVYLIHSLLPNRYRGFPEGKSIRGSESV